MNKTEVVYARPPRVRHNHLTRDVRPPGACPRCDEHHARAAQAPRPVSRWRNGIR